MGHVVRTQEIMNLPSLAPDIQQEILFLPLQSEDAFTVLQASIKVNGVLEDDRGDLIQSWGASKFAEG